MGQALYRKYRSKSLDEIVGQSHITDMLKRAVAKGSISHAYLLTGPRGVGKTSIARILAHEINQLPYTDESVHLDIVEIDAASNNSVDDIRTLREKAMIAPTSAAYKVYIIDEVHMLSKPAFNALLKTLEEPPAHVVFILATTDIEKLPATIISRVQRYNFRLIHPTVIAGHLRTIADAENILIDDEALALIAHHGNGSFRDSISLLDQLQHLNDTGIDGPLIESVLGLTGNDEIEQLLTAYSDRDTATIITLLEASEQRGTPALVLTEQLIHSLRSKVLKHSEYLSLLDELLDVSKSAWPHIKLLTALCLSPDQAHAQAPRQPPKQQTSPSPATISPPPTKKPSVPSPDQPEAVTPEPLPQTPIMPPAASSTTLDWSVYVDAIRADSPALGAILNKIGYNMSDEKVTLYAGNKFNKARLDKGLPLLVKALSDQGIAVEIDIVAATAPPSNSQTAAILDIMGGGEEVKL